MEKSKEPEYLASQLVNRWICIFESVILFRKWQAKRKQDTCQKLNALIRIKEVSWDDLHFFLTFAFIKDEIWGLSGLNWFCIRGSFFATRFLRFVQIFGEQFLIDVGFLIICILTILWTQPCYPETDIKVYRIICEQHYHIIWFISLITFDAGYINSTLNPIIYAIFNQEFRIPFKEILLCRCRGINARLRSQRYAVEYGMLASTASGMGTQFGQTDPSNPNFPGSVASTNKRRSNTPLLRNSSDVGYNHSGYLNRPHIDSLTLPPGHQGRRPSYSPQSWPVSRDKVWFITTTATLAN